MTMAAFIDANIPIYASGREHPYKAPCARILSLVAEHPALFVTDAEVVQELLHRYLALGRWAVGREVLHNFAEVMYGRIEPVYADDVALAANLADEHSSVSSRGLVHAAVMQRLGTRRVVSADTDFDRLPNVTRLDPLRVGDWEHSILTHDHTGPDRQ